MGLIGGLDSIAAAGRAGLLTEVVREWLPDSVSNLPAGHLPQRIALSGG